jgi:dynein heavy chain
MTFQQQIRQLAIKFQSKLKRNYYVTPTSYLELIQTYKTLLGHKRHTVHTLRRRCAPNA